MPRRAEIAVFVDQLGDCFRERRFKLFERLVDVRFLRKDDPVRPDFMVDSKTALENM